MIFPPGADPLGTAAWNAYLRLNRAYRDPFELLASRYREAVEHLGEEVSEDPFLGSPDTALVHHLMGLYLMGPIEFGDEAGLLDRFYEIASVALRGEAINTIGQGLDEEVSLGGELVDRLRALFEQRRAAVQRGSDPSELQGFAWWFRSPVFDPAWAFPELRAVVEAGGSVEPDHVVAERLAMLAPEYALDAISSLALLIDSNTREWFAVGSRDEIRTIVGSALGAGGEAESQARDVINRLVARGYTEFQDLLLR